jgi:Flp pilus assembly protein TadD
MLQPARTSPLDPNKRARLLADCAEAERLLRAGRFPEARRLAEQALRVAPGHAPAVHILGIVEMESGDLDTAARLIRRTTELEPTRPEPFYFLGLTYAQLGRHEDAAAAFRSALALNPELGPALLELSNILQNLGQSEEARAVLRRRLALNPQDMDALRQLARHHAQSLDAGDRAKLAAAAAGSGEAAGTAHMALAELCEAEGDVDAAFAHLRRGNDLLHQALARKDGAPPRQHLPRGAAPRRLAPAAALEDLARRVAFAQLVFKEDFLGRYAGAGHPSHLPIFVLGMPRSGSTLIEQILASHPQVRAAGEIDAAEATLAGLQWPFEGYLQQSVEGMPRFTTPPRPASRYFRELGAAYVKTLRRHGARAQRIVDKMPTNYLYIGMIHLCLPNAVILHSVRDPVDVCLGCYKQIFTSGYETSFDLTLIGRHYRLYRRLMAHWDQVLPGRVVDVVYERLVADPQGEIRRLLAACGLPWDDACLRFHETSRPVQSASQSQVRRPLYTGAVQRWRRYEKHLGPLLAALGPYAPGAG